MTTYTKTTFNPGAAPGISAAELNKMGDGIASAHSELAAHQSAATLDHPDSSVTTAKLADGSVTDAKIGTRTPDQSVPAASGPQTLGTLLSMLANRIKAITGSTNWYDNPATTLAAASTHAASTAAGTHGSATDASANTLAHRDSNGDLTARVLRSTVAAGTAPLAVSSNTVVPNLNACMVDGRHGDALETHVLTLPMVRRLPDLPMNYAHAGVVVNGALYMLLRSSDTATPPSLYKFDPTTRAFTFLASPSVNVADQLVYQDGYIWAVTTTGNIMRYDIVGNSWTTYTDSTPTGQTIAWLMVSATTKQFLIGPKNAAATQPTRKFNWQTSTYSAGPVLPDSFGDHAAFWQYEDTSNSIVLTCTQSGRLARWNVGSNTISVDTSIVAPGVYTTNIWGGAVKSDGAEIELTLFARYGDGTSGGSGWYITSFDLAWGSPTTTTIYVANTANSAYAQGFPGFLAMGYTGFTDASTTSYPIKLVLDSNTGRRYVLQASTAGSNNPKRFWIMK